MKILLVCFCLLLMGCDEINSIFQTDKQEEAKSANSTEKESAPASSDSLTPAPPANENPANENNKTASSEMTEDVKDMYFTKIRLSKEIKEAVFSPRQRVIPENLSPGELKTVRELLFNGEKIYVIPDWWKDEFKNLALLQLRNSGLSSSEALKLQDLTGLTELDLSDNPQLFAEPNKQPLTELWKNLTKLKRLKLSNLQATEADIGDLSSLTSLEELDLSFNKISDLKVLNISGLSQLKRLDLAHNNLATNQDNNLICQQNSSFSFEGLPNSVQELNLQNNHIAILNFNRNLLDLRRLDLREKCQTPEQSHLKIAQGFDGLFELHYLEELNVDADVVEINPQILEKLKIKMRHNLKQRHQVHKKEEDAVEDIQKNLTWKRCSQGQEFVVKEKLNSTCKGTAKTYTWQETEMLQKNLREQKVESEKKTIFLETDKPLQTIPLVANATIEIEMWRLPTYEELKTLVYCENKDVKNANTMQYRISNSTWFWKNIGIACKGKFTKPVIRPTLFHNTPDRCFWTSSESDEDESKAWQVRFNSGAAVLKPKKEKCYVRLVRDNK